jgi:hypothetical protein
MKAIVLTSLVAFGAGAIVAHAVPAHASNGIDVKRGPDATEFGTCVPSLVVENKSAQHIDFLEIQLVVALRNGQERTVELRSAYRGGVPRSIAPGATATLRQQPDLTPSLGVACSEVASRRVGRTICEAAGAACASSVSVQP